eukprot:991414-Rhodomonas_salina.1
MQGGGGDSVDLCYRTGRSTTRCVSSAVRCVSTARGVAPYARSVLVHAWLIARYASTGDGVARAKHERGRGGGTSETEHPCASTSLSISSGRLLKAAKCNGVAPQRLRQSGAAPGSSMAGFSTGGIAA